MRRVLLTVFPAALLALVAVDRLLTWLLPSFATSSAFWELWAVSRPLTNYASRQLNDLTADSIPLQIGLLLAAALMVLMARRPAAWLIANTSAYFYFLAAGLAYEFESAYQTVPLVIGVVFCALSIHALIASRAAARASHPIPI